MHHLSLSCDTVEPDSSHLAAPCALRSTCKVVVSVQGMSITHNITRACVAAAYGQDQLNTLPQLDGLTATMMDEAILMREPLLKRYWASVLTFSQARCRELVTGNNNALQVSM